MTHVGRRVGAVVVLTAWLGAATLLATGVAPAAFAALPSRALAGDVVGRVLPVVFIWGMITGVLAVALSIGRDVWRIAFGTLMVLATAAAQFVIAPRIAELRADMGGAVDIVAADDPRRVLFGQLHGASVGLLGLAMLAALIVLILTLLAMRQRFQESS